MVEKKELDPPLHPGAFALRLVWLNSPRNTYLNYEPVLFSSNSWRKCERTLVRLFARKYLVPVEQTDYVIDVLDGDNTIIQEYGITAAGALFFKRTMHCRKEP